jgi:hypothetical protein
MAKNNNEASLGANHNPDWMAFCQCPSMGHGQHCLFLLCSGMYRKPTDQPDGGFPKRSLIQAGRRTLVEPFLLVGLPGLGPADRSALKALAASRVESTPFQDVIARFNKKVLRK